MKEDVKEYIARENKHYMMFRFYIEDDYEALNNLLGGGNNERNKI